MGRGGCPHNNVEPWDCGCMYGPPSCQSCHITGKCLDCGSSVVAAPAKKKPKQVVSHHPTCDVCREEFADRGLLRRHRESAHGWTDGGRTQPPTFRPYTRWR